MNKLAKTLLGGVALSALATVPAVAEDHPALHYSALHGGRVVNKTKLQNNQCGRDCYTFTIYTSVPASDLHKTVPLVGTYYKWNSNSTFCSNPRQKLKAPKKSIYAKVRAATLTYSEGCPSGPLTFYGETYKLTDPSGEGKTDTFSADLIGRFKSDHGTYKGTLHFVVEVAIGTE